MSRRDWKPMAFKLQREVTRLRAALQEIDDMDPIFGLNPNAKVGDPDALGWNVHDVTREALRTKVEL